MTRLHVEVVGGLEAFLPRGEVDLLHVDHVAAVEVHVARECLVDPFLCARGDFDVRVRIGGECGLVDLLEVSREAVDLRDVALCFDDLLLHIVPEAHVLEVFDEVVVDVHVLARDLVAGEDLCEAGIDTRRGAGDESDVGVRCDCHECRIAHAALNLGTKLIPIEALLFGDLGKVDHAAAVALHALDRVERDHALRPAGPCEVCVAAAFACEICALIDRHVADEFEDAIREVPCVRALIRHRKLFERIGESHDAKSHGAVFFVGSRGLFDGEDVDIDKVVEVTDREAHRLFELDPVDLLALDVSGDIERCEVTYCDIVAVLRQRDLSAEIGHVDRSGVVVERTEVDRVLPGEPWVACGLQRGEDVRPLFGRRHFLEHA